MSVIIFVVIDPYSTPSDSSLNKCRSSSHLCMADSVRGQFCQQKCPNNWLLAGVFEKKIKLGFKLQVKDLRFGLRLRLCLTLGVLSASWVGLAIQAGLAMQAGVCTDGICNWVIQVSVRINNSTARVQCLLPRVPRSENFYLFQVAVTFCKWLCHTGMI